jgi:hypothetical protein
MEGEVIAPCALSSGEGWVCHLGVDFTVKAGELGRGAG